MPDPGLAVEEKVGTQGTIEVVAPGDLGAPVLVTAGRRVDIRGKDGVASVELEEPIEGALGDGRGGVVVS